VVLVLLNISLERVALGPQKKKAGKFFFSLSLFFVGLALVGLSLDFPIFCISSRAFMYATNSYKRKRRTEERRRSKNHQKKKKKKTRETLCVLACHGGASKRDRETERDRERHRERRRVTRAR
jgi:hypothetical protein